MGKEANTWTMSAEIFENCGSTISIVVDYLPLSLKEALYIVKIYFETLDSIVKTFTAHKYYFLK